MSICPAGGFFFQSTSGDRGNFEVVIPAPEFGLWHYWRDNDDPNLKWHGPNKFCEQLRFTSVSVCESDYRTYDNDRPGNFELLARRRDGALIHFFRENGGSWAWSDPGALVATETADNPSLIATGKRGRMSSAKKYLAAVIPDPEHGFVFFERGEDEEEDLEWDMVNVESGPKILGLALIVSAIPYGPEYEHDDPCMTDIASVTVDGHLRLSRKGMLHESEESDEIWKHVRFGVDDLLPQLGQDFTGRPSIIQSDFNLTPIGFLGGGSHGNYELVVPRKAGGFQHLWKVNGHIVEDDHILMEKGWHAGEIVGSERYHEVSMIQSNFGYEHGNLEVVARQPHQAGFDFFWREDDMVWKGPFTIS